MTVSTLFEKHCTVIPSELCLCFEDSILVKLSFTFLQFYVINNETKKIYPLEHAKRKKKKKKTNN
ncbi:hypothetical protein CHUAL_013608 [Chamberlinius hualienensis]